MKQGFIKLLLFFGLLFLSLINANAQRDFRPGYIIDKKGDTIRGYLLYKALNTSSVCMFKTGLDKKPAGYAPADILAFRFDDGRYYIQKTVPLENGNKLAFVEFLIKGKANIFYMRDGADHYFIEKENGKIVELTESEKLISGEHGTAYVRPEQYTGKLKSVLSDCPDIFPAIDRANLNHSSLIRVARGYHAKMCTTENCIVFERKKKPLCLRVGFYAGYTLNTIKFGGELTKSHIAGYVTPYGNQLVSDYSPGILLGFRFEFENIFSIFEHASILIDMAIQKFSTYHLTETGDYDMITYKGAIYMLSRINTVSYQTSMDIDVKTYAIKVPMVFNYTFLKGKVRPYVNAGVMNMFIISQNKDFILDRFATKYGSSIPIYHVGAIGSVGGKVVLNNHHYLFFDLGYEYTQSTNVWPDLRFINNLFEIKAGFSF